MAGRVFLHIGTPKSGTTYLQALLWANRDRLAAADIWLPMETRRDHNQSAADLTGSVGRVLPGMPPTTWDQMVAAISQVSGAALISEELFASVREEGRRRIAESLANTELHIVITARDPIRQVPSMWQQTIKHGAHVTLAEFADRIARDDYPLWLLQQDVGSLVERWAQLVPAERIHVVTVPPSGSSPGLLWQRFAQVLGIDPAGFETPAGLANETLDEVQAEVLRRVNLALGRRLGFPRPYVPVVRYKLVPALAAHRSGGRVVLPDEHLDWAADYSRRTVALLERAGVDVAGDLDELVGEAPQQSRDNAGSYDEEQIAELTIAALADFAVSEAATFDQVDELRAEIKTTRAKLQSVRARNQRLRARLEAGDARPSRTRQLRSLLRGVVR